MNSWKNSVMFRATLLILVLFSIIMIVHLQLEYNSLRAKRDALEAQVSAAEDRVEALNSALETPFDDEYIIRVAREKLNLRLPEEIVFYNDLNH
jgi:cell division protein FtsB